MDHVVPRCKGGATSWTNVVACCNPCNNRKGFSTLRQIEASYGMRLLTGPPRVPSSYDLQARALLLLFARGATAEDPAIAGLIQQHPDPRIRKLAEQRISQGTNHP